MKNKLKRIFSVVLSLLLVTAFSVSDSTLGYADTENITAIDVTEIGTGTAVSHTHIYQTYYDEHYHWQQCAVCGIKTSKTAHSLHGNGGSKTFCDNYGNKAYRDVCSCGYQSGPQILIHGRYENYVNCQRLNYGAVAGMYLSQIKQITQAEFNSLKSSYTCMSSDSSQYTWYDHDGDGYGWVFCGGAIMGDNYGVIGTVKLITGSEGDNGRKNTYDEYHALTTYLYNDSTPTRSEFVSYLNTKINSSSHPSSHCLYGYNTKYSNLSDSKFNQLAAEFKTYYPHTSSWGWSSMNICHTGHNNNGASMYGTSDCYDSCKLANVGPYTGEKRTCDVCGAVYNGDEGYVNTTWCTCNLGNGLNDGEIKTCSGHKIYGKNDTHLATVYCTFKRTGHTVTRTLKAVPVSGGSVSTSGGSWTYSGNGCYTSDEITCTHVDACRVLSYSYVYTVIGTVGSISRGLSCGYYYPLNDDTAPTAYGYSGTATSNSYWKVTGNGSPDNVSTSATIKVTFKDPDQYSLNTLSVRIYDSDKTTPILQTSGSEKMPLTRIGGTAGTGGGDGIWQGTVEICTEVNGTKLVYVQAVDATGYASDKIPMSLQYIDSKGPEIKLESSVNLNSWSNSKSVTLSATDDFDTIYMGLSNEDLRLVSNGTYNNKRTYVINGDMYSGTKDITVYAKDAIGNVTYKKITFSKLDSTNPVNVAGSVSDNFSGGEAVSWNISASGSDQGSGIAGYAITNDTDEPESEDFSTNNLFTIPVSGKYYIWIKDNAGNVSCSECITVHSDILYNGQEINSYKYSGLNLKAVYYNGKRIRI